MKRTGAALDQINPRSYYRADPETASRSDCRNSSEATSRTPAFPYFTWTERREAAELSGDLGMSYNSKQFLRCGAADNRTTEGDQFYAAGRVIRQFSMSQEEIASPEEITLS
jgi:hypothetical protein